MAALDALAQGRGRKAWLPTLEMSTLSTTPNDRLDLPMVARGSTWWTSTRRGSRRSSPPPSAEVGDVDLARRQAQESRRHLLL